MGKPRKGVLYVNIQTDLPPNLPEDLPYNIWVLALEHGMAKFMLQWRQEFVPDDQVIIAALMMIEKTCTQASYSNQRWLEIEFGKDLPNMYNALLRRSARWLTLDLTSLSPVKPRGYGPKVENIITRPQRIIVPRNTD